MFSRLQRVTVALAIVAATGAARLLACPTYHEIPNTTLWAGLRITWSPPAGAPAGTVYQVFYAAFQDYCHLQTAYYPVLAGTTTSTSFALTLPPNSAYMIWVNEQADSCTQSPGIYADTFTTLPATPSLTSATANGNNVTLTFSYTDPRSKYLQVYRAGSDGKFSTFVGSMTFWSTPCGSAPLSLTDKNVPNGTYQYELTAFNAQGTVMSAPLTVTVGASPPAITSFTATPQTVRAGQAATLSWTTQNATSVTIDQGLGTQPSSGTATVTPAATTTYTLTAMNGSLSSTATTSVAVVTAPSIVVGSFPRAMLQQQGLAGATTSYSLTNAGGAATTIALTKSGTFFSQSPASFTLNPGATQIVTVTGSAQPAGEFEGASMPSGNGVAAGLSIPIKLLSAAPPAGVVTAKPAAGSRVDVAAPPGSSPGGTVSFANTGTATLTGVLNADVPWIVPQSGMITITPGSTAALTFTIDRTKRPDAAALAGSAVGNLSLLYPSGGSGALDVTPVGGISIVTVVDTVQLTVTPGATPPALSPGEVALFIAGAGHVTGSVGTFVSDIALLNPLGNSAISDLKFFFTPSSGAMSMSAALPALANTGIALADVVKSVFSGEGQLGTLQIRSGSATKVSVATNVFNTSNPAGTYGTTIPTFRSDRAVAAGDHLVLSGLLQGTTGHTNLFIQETSGAGVTVQTEFLDMNGTTLGTRSDAVGAFALALVSGAVPQGAVAAILTNKSAAPATFLAYATPVDQESGDTWSIVDWPRQCGYSGSDPVIVPVAGVLQGANNTFFRTDLSITNSGTATAAGTLRFYPRGGSPADRQITLGARQTQIIANVIGSFFGFPSGSVGYLRFTPSSGTFVVTSRTYTTVTGSLATYGTHVPTVAAASGMGVGSFRTIGSIHDAGASTILAARPATFRTNLGILETSGNTVTVRVTLNYPYAAGVKLTAFGVAQKDYTLGPNEFRQINGIAADILGSARDAFGDLHDIEADFQVVSGSGTVIIYTSSTDNGTGDSILRME